MPYVPIDPAALDVEKVIQSSTHVQINENAEDTRAIATQNQTDIGALDFNLVKLMYRKAFDFSPVTDHAISTSFTDYDLDQPITNEIVTPSGGIDFAPISNNKLDFSLFKFGDSIKVKVNAAVLSASDITMSISGVELLSSMAGASNDIELIIPIDNELKLVETPIRFKGAPNIGSLKINSIEMSINIG